MEKSCSPISWTAVGGISRGNLIPGTPFEDFLVYTPVVGVRVAWGKFYLNLVLTKFKYSNILII